MITAGKVVEKILRDMNREANAVDEAYVWDILNLKYIEICAQHSFLLLRKQPITIDLADATYSTGMWLPSDVLGIDRVRDEDDQEYLHKDNAEIDPEEANYRYYTYKGSEDPLLADQAVTTLNGTSITGASAPTVALTSNGVGEYFTVNGKYGLHKLVSYGGSSAYTISPASRYTSGAATITIRPEFTRKIVCIDPDGDEVEDKEIRVWYWGYPPPLIDDNDSILLPTADPLILKVLREMPEAKGRRAVSAQEADQAMQTCINLNPSFARENFARDRRNNLFRVRSVPYTERD